MQTFVAEDGREAARKSAIGSGKISVTDSSRVNLYKSFIFLGSRDGDFVNGERTRYFVDNESLRGSHLVSISMCK